MSTSTKEQDQRSQMQEQMTRRASIKMATSASTNEQGRRVAEDAKRNAQEQMARRASIKIATSASDNEQNRRIAEDAKSTAQEQMTRSMNQKKAADATNEEQTRRVAEDNTERKANARRASQSIMDELVATAGDTDSDKVYVLADE